jgi:hypothetical protein
MGSTFYEKDGILESEKREEQREGISTVERCYRWNKWWVGGCLSARAQACKAGRQSDPLKAE